MSQYKKCGSFWASGFIQLFLARLALKVGVTALIERPDVDTDLRMRKRRRDRLRSERCPIQMNQMLLVPGKSRLKSAAPLAGHYVRITWADGIIELKDVGPLLINHRSFAQVRSDRSVFETVRVADDGSRLIWNDGTSLTARALEKLPRSEMDAAEFRGIMADLHLTSDALGSLLGLSRRAITGYRNGEPVPKAVALAMQYLLQRWDA